VRFDPRQCSVERLLAECESLGEAEAPRKHWLERFQQPATQEEPAVEEPQEAWHAIEAQVIARTLQVEPGDGLSSEEIIARVRDLTEGRGADIVLECTGLFASKEKAGKHLAGGAKKVVVSAPADGVDATIVYGVNHQTLRKEMTVISNASCTTNCLAPLAKALDDRIGIVSGLMTTVHAYTNDQVLTDVFHKDLRRARSATQNMIPTKTGAAAAVGLVLPHLNGKLDGYAIRVPTINVSIVDLTFTAKRATSVDEVNAAVKKAAEGALKGILEVNAEPLVSSDFNHNPASSIFDASLTKVNGGTLVKVGAWYDNEWGFSNRMLDAAVALMNAK
jgi:glyceraldehyde 3-phosphate dehydrogenase